MTSSDVASAGQNVEPHTEVSVDLLLDSPVDKMVEEIRFPQIPCV